MTPPACRSRRTFLAVSALLLAAATVASPAVALAQGAADTSKELVVLPFVPDADVLKKALNEEHASNVSFGLELSSILIQSLIAKEYTGVLAPEQLKYQLERRNLMDKGMVSEDDALAIGGAVKAKYLLLASITGFKSYKPRGDFGPTRGEVELSAKVVDVSTGKYVPVSLVGYGRLETGSFSLEEFLRKKLFRGDQWLTSFLGDAARIATADLAIKYIQRFSDGLVDVKLISAKRNLLFVDAGIGWHVALGDNYVVYQINEERDKEGKVQFAEPVKVAIAKVNSVQRGASRMEIVSLESGVKIDDLERKFSAKVPFTAEPEVSYKRRIEREAAEKAREATKKDKEKGKAADGANSGGA